MSLIASTVALVIEVYADYLLGVVLNEKSWTDPFLTSKQQEGEIALVFRQCNGARFGRGSTRDGFPHAMARREDGRPGEASGGFREAHDDDGGEVRGDVSYRPRPSSSRLPRMFFQRIAPRLGFPRRLPRDPSRAPSRTGSDVLPFPFVRTGRRTGISPRRRTGGGRRTATS